ncbi:hypothetical protein JCM19233_6227 [Vibrio astriarenae]|nr:hypothetical protein JCM19233_6227 [Vibrio sp. C7]
MQDKPHHKERYKEVRRARIGDGRDCLIGVSLNAFNQPSTVRFASVPKQKSSTPSTIIKRRNSDPFSCLSGLSK